MKNIILLTILGLLIAACSVMEKMDNDDKVKRNIECKTCHYCSPEKIHSECKKQREKMVEMAKNRELLGH